MINNDDSTPPDNAGGGFGIGVVVGALAGAGAFYLFGTKNGIKLKEKLIDEYYQAKQDLEQNPEFQVATQKMEQTAKAIQHTLESDDTKMALDEAKHMLAKLNDKIHSLTQKNIDGEVKSEQKSKKSPTKTSHSIKRHFKKK